MLKVGVYGLIRVFNINIKLGLGSEVLCGVSFLRLSFAGFSWKASWMLAWNEHCNLGVLDSPSNRQC